MARPRKYPVGTTAADIAREATKRLVAQGGARKTLALSGRAIENMRIIRAERGDSSDTALIERLLEEERCRVVSAPPP